jgi:hypothetical protein
MLPPAGTKKLSQLPGMLTFVIAAPALWAVAGIVILVERNLLHWPRQFWYPFFGDASFTDFTIFRPHFAAFGTPQFWQPRSFPFTYPASAAVAFEVFFSIPRHHLGPFLISLAAAALLGAWAAGRALLRRGLEFKSTLLFVGVALVSSYPFMFLFDRANIEIVNWIFVTFAIAALWCERWNLAGVLLGIAISLKLFPFVLLGLFLARRKYLAMIVAVGTAVAADIASLAILGPTIRIANQQIALGMQFFQSGYIAAIHKPELPFDHSLFAIVKHAAAHRGVADPVHLARFAHWYMEIAAVGALAVYFSRVIRLPRVNQIVILLTLSVLLPPVSGDYTLVHLYAGWMVLTLVALDAEPGIVRSRVLPACFLILAIVFCPETYMFAGAAHFAGSFKALALCVLVILLLVYRLDEKRPRLFV